MASKKRKKKKNTRNKSSIYIFILVVLILFFIYIIVNNWTNLTLKPKEIKSSVKIKKTEKKVTVLDAINHAVQLLGIPDKFYQSRMANNAVIFTIIIDKDRLDLNYANMIITGQIELAGGKIMSGKEINNKYRNRQILEIFDPAKNQKYKIILKYDRNNEYKSKGPELAIVVDDFGYFGGDLLDKFCKLDTNITFAILPYLNFSKEVMLKANNNGHETIIHMPMEPISYPKNNPGSHAIYVHNSDKEIQRQVENYIRQLPLCIGANNHMGSLATADKNVMKTVLKVLKKNKMFFIDSRTTNASVAYKTAQEMMIPSAENMMFLDSPDLSEKTFQTKIAALKKLKKKHKKMVVITHCTGKNKYLYLKKFIVQAKEMGFKLIPASMLFKNNLPEFI